eukprot:FR736054.1.p1 GENE.FR736054.1~~FR736054.1.p1  ORF type:complete len:114 (+),score=33.57 FR736054.1:779-1120(+)
MNPPTRGERRFGYWGALPLPRSLTRFARSFGLGQAVYLHYKAVIRVFPQKSGNNPGKKFVNKKGRKKGQKPLKRSRFAGGFFHKGPPPPEKKLNKKIQRLQSKKGGQKPPRGT